MRFLLDESADFPLAEFLREKGHDVTAIAHDYPHALKDREVLDIAVRERRIIITNDRDFGELVFRQQLPHSGIILFRLRSEELRVKQVRLEDVITTHAAELYQFLVITRGGIRVRQKK